MKVVKTALGWEIRPQNDNEESHVRWLVALLAPPAWSTMFVEDANVPPDTIISSDQIARVVRDMSPLQRATLLSSIGCGSRGAQ